MKRNFLVFVALAVLGVSAGAKAQVTPPASLKMKVGIGLGFQLCPEKNGAAPALQDAFLCPGMKGIAHSVELDLQNKPASNPNWLFFEAPYAETIKFNNVTVTLKALVMYAKLDTYTMGYVDGSLTSTQNGVTSAPSYFRVSAEGGLDKLTYSSSFGSVSPIVLSDKSTGRFLPYVVVQASP